MTVEALAMMSMGVSVEEIPAKARHSQGTAAEKSRVAGLALTGTSREMIGRTSEELTTLRLITLRHC